MASLPKAVCEIHADLLKTRAKLVKAYKEGKITLNGIIKTIGEILWGIFDASVADLMSAIANVAMNMAQALAAQLSAAIAGILQAILQELLSVFLQTVDGLYALTAIPHEKAVEHLNLEQIYLGKVSSKMGVITSIIRKWVTKSSNVDYYATMKRALPFIQKAFALLTDVIEGLENETNATFDVAKYTDALANIKESIEITGPDTNIDRMFNPMSAINDRKTEILDKEIASIKATYKRLKDEASTTYQDEVVGVRDEDGPVIDISAEATEYAARLKYRAKIKTLDADEVLQLAAAEAEAMAKASREYLKTGIGSAFGSLKDEFNADMILMMENLRFLPDDIALAYTSNKATQSLCNTLYNFKDTVLKLIEFLIALIRHAGNGAGVAAGAVMKGARAAVGVAEDFVVEGIAEFDDPENDKSSMEAAAELIGARSALIGADIMLGATITDALVKLINLDDSLDASSDAYKAFTSQLANIPDWDGTKNIWAVNPLMGSLNPYIRLIKESSAMVLTATVAIVPGPGGQAKLEKLDKSIGKIQETMGTLQTHNSEVLAVINRWTPPYSYHMDKLKEAMSKIPGMLDLFAFGLSFVSVLASLGISLKDMNIDWQTCQEAFPDLYSDPDVEAMLESDSVNYPSIAESNPAGLEESLSALQANNIAYNQKTRNAVIADRSELNVAAT